MILSAILFFLKAIPITLSILWVVGAFIYYYTRERNKSLVPPHLARWPKATIIVPCHNEEKIISATIFSMDHIDYPDFELIAVNDGSHDRTIEKLRELAETRSYMRTIDLKKNRGKAAALNIGLLASQGEFVICVDADSELHRDSLRWLIAPLLANEQVGAVTGNPRVKNRNSLIGRLQVGEFSAMIGMIKRYHQVIGGLFTVSGVIVAFRKRALLEVGLWDTESVTEDIAVSWRLQSAGWELVYEPRAICDVLMPGTLKGLWRQRYRWAKGGLEVMSKHKGLLIAPGKWRLKVLYAEYVFSVLWTLLFVFSACIALSSAIFSLDVGTLWFRPLHWGIFLIGALGFAQFLPGMSIHGRYEKPTVGLVFWSIWYPFAYWILNSAVLLVAAPKTLLTKRPQFGTWVSPDRGGIL